MVFCLVGSISLLLRSESSRACVAGAEAAVQGGGEVGQGPPVCPEEPAVLESLFGFFASNLVGADNC